MLSDWVLGLVAGSRTLAAAARQQLKHSLLRTRLAINAKLAPNSELYQATWKLVSTAP